MTSWVQFPLLSVCWQFRMAFLSPGHWHTSEHSSVNLQSDKESTQLIIIIVSTSSSVSIALEWVCLHLPHAYLFAEAQQVQRCSILGVLATSGHGLLLCSLLLRRSLLSLPQQTPFSLVEPEVYWELALPLTSWVAWGKRVDFTEPVSSNGDLNSMLGAVYLKYLLRIQIPGL